MNARLEELLLRLVNTSGPVRALSASECHELLGLVEALDELVMKPKWCPDRCPITFRPFFMWLEHPEKGLVPTYGGPYDSYTIPEPEMPEDGKKTEFHDIEFYCERYDHDEGAWVDGSEDPCHRVIIQDRLAELDEFNDLKARVKELEGLRVLSRDIGTITLLLDQDLSTVPPLTLGEAMPRKVVGDSKQDFAHEWQITVRADSPIGAMDAVWKCWEAWKCGHEPYSGCCPASMGDRMDYTVKKIKGPMPGGSK